MPVDPDAMPEAPDAEPDLVLFPFDARELDPHAAKAPVATPAPSPAPTDPGQEHRPAYVVPVKRNRGRPRKGEPAGGYIIPPGVPENHVAKDGWIYYPPPGAPNLPPWMRAMSPAEHLAIKGPELARLASLPTDPELDRRTREYYAEHAKKAQESQPTAPGPAPVTGPLDPANPLAAFPPYEIDFPGMSERGKALWRLGREMAAVRPPPVLPPMTPEQEAFVNSRVALAMSGITPDWEKIDAEDRARADREAAKYARREAKRQAALKRGEPEPEDEDDEDEVIPEIPLAEAARLGLIPNPNHPRGTTSPAVKPAPKAAAAPAAAPKPRAAATAATAATAAPPAPDPTPGVDYIVPGLPLGVSSGVGLTPVNRAAPALSLRDALRAWLTGTHSLSDSSAHIIVSSATRVWRAGVGLQRTELGEEAGRMDERAILRWWSTMLDSSAAINRQITYGWSWWLRFCKTLPSPPPGCVSLPPGFNPPGLPARYLKAVGVLAGYCPGWADPTTWQTTYWTTELGEVLAQKRAALPTFAANQAAFLALPDGERLLLYLAALIDDLASYAAPAGWVVGQRLMPRIPYSDKCPDAPAMQRAIQLALMSPSELSALAAAPQKRRRGRPSRWAGSTGAPGSGSTSGASE